MSKAVGTLASPGEPRSWENAEPRQVREGTEGWAWVEPGRAWGSFLFSLVMMQGSGGAFFFLSSMSDICVCTYTVHTYEHVCTCVGWVRD